MTAEQTERPGEAPQRLLLIDDDVLLPGILRPWLRLVPGEFVLLTARDGERGTDIAAAIRPHLILLDYCLPGLDGFDTLDRLRANALTAGIPVVTISGAIATRGRCAEMIARTDAYLAKPLDFARLAAILERLLLPDAAPERSVDHDHPPRLSFTVGSRPRRGPAGPDTPTDSRR